MTPEQFKQWIKDVKAAGWAKRDYQIGEMIGISRQTMCAYKKKGAPLIVAYACAAFLDGLYPYGAEIND